MKLLLASLFLSIALHTAAQEIEIPRLKVAINEEKINYIIKETLSCMENGIQVSFSAQSDFFGNTNSLSKKTAPANESQINKLKKKICRCPDDMNTFLEIGILYNRLYQPDSARAYLSRSLGICMDEKVKFPNKKNLAHTEAKIYSQAGDYASSVALYEKILKENPNDTIARLFLTVSYLGTGDTAKFSFITKDNYKQMPNEMVFTFFHIVEKGYSSIFRNEIPENKQITLREFTDLNLLNQLPVENNDSTKIKDAWHALLIFNGYLKFILQSNDTTILKDELGYFKIGNEIELNKTISYFTERTKNKKNKNAFMHHKFIAMAYFLLGDFKSSILSLEKSIATFPKDKGDTGDNNTAEQYNNVAATYFMMRDTLMVIKSLENKISKKPKIDPDPNDHVTLGNFYLMQKNEVKAKFHYEEALKINTYQIYAYIGLASIEFKYKRYEQAMPYLNKAYEINPNEPNIYYLTAAMNLVNNQSNEAYQIYSQLLEYFPDNEFLQEVINQFYGH